MQVKKSTTRKTSNNINNRMEQTIIHIG